MARKNTPKLSHTFRRAVYAGSFSPITRGHHDVILQAARSYDELYIAVGINPQKQPLFTPEERIAMIEHDIRTVIAPALAKDGVKCHLKVVSYDGATARFMQAVQAPFYVRGLRLGTEFDAELPSLQISKQMYPDYTPVFFCSTKADLQKVSSTMARELCALREDALLGQMVTPHVQEKLIARMQERKLRP